MGPCLRDIPLAPLSSPPSLTTKQFQLQDRRCSNGHQNRTKKISPRKARKYKVNATKINFLAWSGENMRFFLLLYLTNSRHGTFVYVLELLYYTLGSTYRVKFWSANTATIPGNNNFFSSIDVYHCIKRTASYLINNTPSS